MKIKITIAAAFLLAALAFLIWITPMDAQLDLHPCRAEASGVGGPLE